MKTLSVGEVIDGDRKFFTGRTLSIRIVIVFFEEVLKLLIAGHTVRFPRKGNGNIRLVFYHYTAASLKSFMYRNKGAIMQGKGVVKPRIINFDVKTGGRMGINRKFSLLFSFDQRWLSVIKSYFVDEKTRRKLPEIGG